MDPPITDFVGKSCDRPSICKSRGRSRGWSTSRLWKIETRSTSRSRVDRPPGSIPRFANWPSIFQSRGRSTLDRGVDRPSIEGSIDHSIDPSICQSTLDRPLDQPLDLSIDPRSTPRSTLDLKIDYRSTPRSTGCIRKLQWYPGKNVWTLFRNELVFVLSISFDLNTGRMTLMFFETVRIWSWTNFLIYWKWSYDALKIFKSLWKMFHSKNMHFCSMCQPNSVSGLLESPNFFTFPSI